MSAESYDEDESHPIPDSFDDPAPESEPAKPAYGSQTLAGVKRRMANPQPASTTPPPPPKPAVQAFKPSSTAKPKQSALQTRAKKGPANRFFKAAAITVAAVALLMESFPKEIANGIFKVREMGWRSDALPSDATAIVVPVARAFQNAGTPQKKLALENAMIKTHLQDVNDFLDVHDPRMPAAERAADDKEIAKTYKVFLDAVSGNSAVLAKGLPKLNPYDSKNQEPMQEARKPYREPFELADRARKEEVNMAHLTHGTKPGEIPDAQDVVRRVTAKTPAP